MRSPTTSPRAVRCDNRSARAATQRPFAQVIVGGLFSRLLISVFLMPALYALVARPHDKLEV